MSDDYPLIQRTAPKRPDRIEAVRKNAYSVTVMLSPEQMFELLGIVPPAEGTAVHILLARSHGNEGGSYTLPGGNLVEVRMRWETEG